MTILVGPVLASCLLFFPTLGRLQLQPSLAITFEAYTVSAVRPAPRQVEAERVLDWIEGQPAYGAIRGGNRAYISTTYVLRRHFALLFGTPLHVVCSSGDTITRIWSYHGGCDGQTPQHVGSRAILPSFEARPVLSTRASRSWPAPSSTLQPGNWNTLTSKLA